MENSLYKAIYKSISGRLSAYLIQFLFLSIYTRIFSPYEFGILASVQVFTIFFQMLTDVGIAPAIINEKEFSQDQRNGVFSFTLIVGLILAILFYIFSFFLNFFYKDYEYQNLALVIGVSIIFNALTIVPNTALVKDTLFLKIAKSDILSEVISFILVFIMYKYGFGILSLVSKNVFVSIFRFLFNYLYSKNTEMGRAILGKNIRAISNLAGFALYQFGFNIINYFSRNLDNILVGKYIGMESLGIYDKAYQLMRYPLLITSFAMGPAIQPVLTKVRYDNDKVIREHNLLTKRLLIISCLISSFIYINAKEIILILFGSQWGEVTQIVKIFAVMIPIQAVLSTVGSFFQVMNKPKLLFYSGLISSFFNVVAICTGVFFGTIVIIAKLLVISFVINFFQNYHILFKYCFKESARKFYFNLSYALFISFIPTCIYLILRHYVEKIVTYNLYLSFSINVALSLLALVISIKFLKKAFEI